MNKNTKNFIKNGIFLPNNNAVKHTAEGSKVTKTENRTDKPSHHAPI